MLGKTPADGTGLLRAKVEREQLLVLVRLPQRRLLLLRDHREDPRDRGTNHLAAGTTQELPVSMNEHPQKLRYTRQERRNVHLGELVGGTAGDLGDTEEGELRLEVLELALQLRLVLPPQLVHLDPGCNRWTGKCHIRVVLGNKINQNSWR